MSKVVFVGLRTALQNEGDRGSEIEVEYELPETAGASHQVGGRGCAVHNVHVELHCTWAATQALCFTHSVLARGHFGRCGGLGRPKGWALYASVPMIDNLVLF